MKTYTVTCTETCPECAGERIVSNPLWQSMFADLEEVEARSGEVDDFDAFVKNWEREHIFGSMGPEEYPCEACEGTGKISHDVPLADALRELGINVNPTLQEPTP